MSARRFCIINARRLFLALFSPAGLVLLGCARVNTFRVVDRLSGQPLEDVAVTRSQKVTRTTGEGIFRWQVESMDIDDLGTTGPEGILTSLLPWKASAADDKLTFYFDKEGYTPERAEDVKRRLNIYRFASPTPESTARASDVVIIPMSIAPPTTLPAASLPDGAAGP